MPGGDSLRHPRHGEFMPDVPQAGTQPPKKQQAHQEDKKKRLKDTLNLPQTAFPMKANLPRTSPIASPAGRQPASTTRSARARAGAPKYILHDGPPYANGAIHLGHALNKCSRTSSSRPRPWPASTPPTSPAGTATASPSRSRSTSSSAAKSSRWTPSPSAAPAASTPRNTSTCSAPSSAASASSAAGTTPTLTMSSGYEARIVETFYDFFEKGFVYKGLKPVYWCIHDRTALAEAEVEYEQHTSPQRLRPLQTHQRPRSDRPRARRQRRSTPSSGPPPPGRCPHRWPSPSIPRSSTSRSTRRRHVYIVAEALLAAVIVACQLMSAANLTNLHRSRHRRPLPRRQARRRHLPASVPRPHASSA